jgi:hypothetical protein
VLHSKVCHWSESPANLRAHQLRLEGHTAIKKSVKKPICHTSKRYGHWPLFPGSQNTRQGCGGRAGTAVGGANNHLVEPGRRTDNGLKIRIGTVNVGSLNERSGEDAGGWGRCTGGGEVDREGD